MGDLVIHANVSCQVQEDGRWAASCASLPVFAVGDSREESLSKLQDGMRELAAWWMTQPRPEYEAWLDGLRARGTEIEPLEPGRVELVIPVLAHA
jgi:hypothetical protein